jgi:hypothetical protein
MPASVSILMITVAGDAVDLHRFDVGYFDFVPVRGN